MLNIIEFTRECLTIRIGRKLKAVDAIDTLSDLFILRGVPPPHSFRQRHGIDLNGGPAMVPADRRRMALHRAGQSSRHASS